MSNLITGWLIDTAPVAFLCDDCQDIIESKEPFFFRQIVNYNPHLSQFELSCCSVVCICQDCLALLTY